MYKHKVSMKELMDMNSTEFYALYYSAWRLSMARTKEAEAEAEAMAKAEKQSRGNSQPPPSQMQRMQLAMQGLNSGDFQDVIEEME